VSFSYEFYFISISIAAILSFYLYKKGQGNSIFIMVVLIATLLVEVSSWIIRYYRITGYTFIMHIFNLLEYTMFCMYYLKSCQNKKLRLWVKLSIPLFILFCLCASFFKYRFNAMPVLNIEVEGFLLFIIYTHLLFNINVDENRFIYTHPDFWMSLGIMIFFGGVFVYLGLYPVLLHVDNNEALRTYYLILYPLNIIFYYSIIIGLICLIRNRKYLIR
jgi:hypothetical protein